MSTLHSPPPSPLVCKLMVVWTLDPLLAPQLMFGKCEEETCKLEQLPQSFKMLQVVLACPNCLVINLTSCLHTHNDQEIKSFHLCQETKMGSESQVFPWLFLLFAAHFMGITLI